MPIGRLGADEEVLVLRKLDAIELRQVARVCKTWHCLAPGLLGELDVFCAGRFVTNDDGDNTLGLLYHPQGAGPHPAVIVLHGSGGLVDEPTDATDPNDVQWDLVNAELENQFEEWAELLTAEGYVVAMPASFFSRGFHDWNDDPHPNLDAEDRLRFRVFDLRATVDVLAARDDVDISRLGLVGFGATAREVAARANALGMRVSAWTPRLEAAMANPHRVEVAESLDTLLAGADVVSVHCPLNAATRGMIGARELSQIPKGGIFIHTARGGIVDDAALAAHAKSGHLRVGLDVYEGEPGASSDAFESDLRGIPSAVLTPHIGASTAQALESTGAEVTRIIRDFATLGTVHNVVNVADASRGRHRLIVRHQDRVGVLAGVLDALRRAEHNVKEMQNIIFDGAEGDIAAASATMLATLSTFRSMVMFLSATEHDLHDAVWALNLSSRIVLLFSCGGSWFSIPAGHAGWPPAISTIHFRKAPT